MKRLWCWRCRAEVPMLDDPEFTRAMSFRKMNETLPPKEEFRDALREYNGITGFAETNPVPVYHHRLSMYGPPCKKCGKPLRTPRAKLCGACMEPV